MWWFYEGFGFTVGYHDLSFVLIKQIKCNELISEWSRLAVFPPLSHKPPGSVQGFKVDLTYWNKPHLQRTPAQKDFPPIRVGSKSVVLFIPVRVGSSFLQGFWSITWGGRWFEQRRSCDMNAVKGRRWNATCSDPVSINNIFKLL